MNEDDYDAERAERVERLSEELRKRHGVSGNQLVYIGSDGAPHVLEQPDTAWDRDARAFVVAFIARNPWKGMPADAMREEEIACRAAAMADGLEAARRRCTEERQPHPRGGTIRCKLRQGHDGGHSF